MIYQDMNFKICLSLFGWKENILPKMHIVQCNFASVRADKLKRHLTSCPGEKSNKCNLCNLASAQEANPWNNLKTF